MKTKRAAAKFLDYGYSEEGHMLYNFGIEGVSYEMVDGYPKYTELITNNPDNLTMQHAMGRYMASAYGGPFIQDKRYYEQYLPYEEQKEAVSLLVATDRGAQNSHCILYAGRNRDNCQCRNRNQLFCRRKSAKIYYRTDQYGSV